MLESMLMYSPGKVSGDGEKEYEEFLTIIQYIKEVPANGQPAQHVGYLRVNLAYNESGGLWGTPWEDFVTTDSRIARIATHCFPNYEARNNTHANGRYVAIKFDFPEFRGAFKALNRNGLTSSSFGTTLGQQVTDFIYYDDVLEGMQRMNPFRGEGPIPWDKQLIL